MAGGFFIGIPVLAGTVSGLALQVGMRSYDVDLVTRVSVEMALIGAGALGCLMSPIRGNAEQLMFFVFVLSTGLFAMGDGAIFEGLKKLHEILFSVAAKQT